MEYMKVNEFKLMPQLSQEFLRDSNPMESDFPGYPDLSEFEGYRAMREFHKWLASLSPEDFDKFMKWKDEVRDSRTRMTIRAIGQGLDLSLMRGRLHGQ